MMPSDRSHDHEPNPALLAAIPDAARPHAADAIRQAFPAGRLQSIDRLHGGMSSALVYKLRIDDHMLVLRMVQHGTAPGDPHRPLRCMQHAADSGVAPRVFHANADTGVSLSAFIEPPSVAVPRDAAQLGALLRTLHRGPAFPVHLDAFQAIDGGLAQLAHAGVALPLPVREALDAFAVIRQVITPHLTLAPCHNDLNPGNVLQDGERQWLVDWDSACMNDPLFDVASTIHWFRLDAARERGLLQAYFGRAPSAHELAKLELMKHVVWCYYMLVFLLISLPDGGVGDMDAVDRATLPSFAAFIDGVGRGEHQLHDANTRRRLSLILGNSSLHAMRRREFAAAMERLRA